MPLGSWGIKLIFVAVGGSLVAVGLLVAVAVKVGSGVSVGGTGVGSRVAVDVGGGGGGDAHEAMSITDINKIKYFEIILIWNPSLYFSSPNDY